jgi:hypothetical protein
VTFLPLEEEINRVKGELRRKIIESGREILQEVELKDKWGFTVRHGNFTLQLVHRKDEARMMVIFVIQFPDDVISQIRDVCSDPMRRTEFEFGLKSAITSPLTLYRLHLQEGYVTGYEVQRAIFPFHTEFTIKDLDEAITSVISTGVLGLSYLEAILGVRRIELETTEPIRRPPPDSMYI